MKLRWILAAALIVGLAGCSRKTAGPFNPGGLPTYSVGGVAIALPTPGGEFSEAGDAGRSKFDVLCPDVNRLVAAYALTEAMPRIIAGNGAFGMSRYALVEIVKKAEFTDFSPDDFNQATAAMDAELSTNLDKDFKDSQVEINARCQQMNIGQFDLGKPRVFGTLFSKPSAKGIGLMTAVKNDGATQVMACSVSLVRVNQRVICVYLYCDYKDQTSIKWLGETSEAWANAIVTANGGD